MARWSGGLSALSGDVRARYLRVSGGSPMVHDERSKPENDMTVSEALETEGALALAVSDEPAITREQRRSRRKRDVRARTISVKRMTKRELEIGRLLYPETEYDKPRTRAECA